MWQNTVNTNDFEQAHTRLCASRYIPFPTVSYYLAIDQTCFAHIWACSRIPVKKYCQDFKIF